jgi:outer membrane protein assembly factor BamB
LIDQNNCKSVRLEIDDDLKLEKQLQIHGNMLWYRAGGKSDNRIIAVDMETGTKKCEYRLPSVVCVFECVLKLSKSGKKLFVKNGKMLMVFDVSKELIDYQPLWQAKLKEFCHDILVSDDETNIYTICNGSLYSYDGASRERHKLGRVPEVRSYRLLGMHNDLVYVQPYYY